MDSGTIPCRSFWGTWSVRRPAIEAQICSGVGIVDNKIDNARTNLSLPELVCPQRLQSFVLRRALRQNLTNGTGYHPNHDECSFYVPVPTLEKNTCPPITTPHQPPSFAHHQSTAHFPASYRPTLLSAPPLPCSRQSLNRPTTCQSFPCARGCQR